MVRNATRFRNGLKKLGYIMLQKSVYIKLISNGSTFRTEQKYVRQFTPGKGSVLIIPIPLRHFIKIKSLAGEPFPLETLTSSIINL